MSLSFMQTLNAIVLVLFLIIFVLALIALIRTLVFVNRQIRVLKKSSLSGERINDLQSNMTTLLESDIASGLEKVFSVALKNGELKKIGNGYIYQYAKKEIDSAKILINIPITKFEGVKVDTTNQGVYGENTYRSKSVLYSVFDALENIILQERESDINLTILIYKDENTHLELVDYLIKNNEQFDLVLGEGGKILDPVISGLKSYYAFIGTGINEEVVIRYKTKKVAKGEKRIKDFVNEINNSDIFEMKFEKTGAPVVKKLARDMLFGNRFILNNTSWFPTLSKRIIKEELGVVNKAWITKFFLSDILEEENYYYLDIKFNLSSYENKDNIISIFEKFVLKYSLEYEVINEKEKSERVGTHTPSYKLISSIVDESFLDLYTVNYTVFEDVLDRASYLLSKNVIRFVPLYYSRDALTGIKTGDEGVTYSSVDKAISFYEELFIQLGGKAWKDKNL